jgi:hypothetical protein
MIGVLKQLLVCLGTALATAAGLFTLQIWYASYLDVAVIHRDQSHAPMHAKLQAVREEERAKLASGQMPIDRAMEALAQRGKSEFPRLAVKPSDDISAMSGWMHKPGFKMYVPRPVAAAAEEARRLAGAAAQVAPKGSEGAR